jgi:hypothetical protein
MSVVGGNAKQAKQEIMARRKGNILMVFLQGGYKGIGVFSDSQQLIADYL